MIRVRQLGGIGGEFSHHIKLKFARCYIIPIRRFAFQLPPVSCCCWSGTVSSIDIFLLHLWTFLIFLAALFTTSRGPTSFFHLDISKTRTSLSMSNLLIMLSTRTSHSPPPPQTIFRISPIPRFFSRCFLICPLLLVVRLPHLLFYHYYKRFFHGLSRARKSFELFSLLCLNYNFVFFLPLYFFWESLGGLLQSSPAHSLRFKHSQAA